VGRRLDSSASCTLRTRRAVTKAIEEFKVPVIQRDLLIARRRD
jgi:hypothetical protein